jgi:hypothetical protein
VKVFRIATLKFGDEVKPAFSGGALALGPLNSGLIFLAATAAILSHATDFLILIHFIINKS